jgi:hypothetical protein
MKKKLALIFVLTFSTIYSQSKKEQFQSLSFKIDSLNTIINNNNLRFNEEVNNLKKENLQLSNAISNDKITFEEKISSVNDSLLILNNFNKNLNVKISKQLEIIELFNNALFIENRGFDPYKDSKLFSQILFLRILYHFDKIDGYFGSTYYGVVLGNRLVNANPTEIEKKIFEDEVRKHLIYYVENFSDYNINPNIQIKIAEGKDLTKLGLTFDKIVKQLNDVRPWFEPYIIGKEYALINNIDRILSKIEKEWYKENQVKLIID